MTSVRKQKDAEKAEALKWLRKQLRPGDTVYTVLRHVSASGMSRRIDLYAIRKNRPVYLSGYAGTVLGYKRHPREQGLTVGGCGMDMGFAVVYELSSAMFPKGFRVTPKTPGRNGQTEGIDTDGGYALKQQWL